MAWLTAGQWRFAAAAVMAAAGCFGCGGSDAPSAASGAGPGEHSQSGAGQAAPASAAPKTFRITELFLRDPHLFLGQVDITEQSALGVSVNADLIKGGLTTDYDADGFVDVSILATLTPYDTSATGSGMLQLRDGQCAAKDPKRCMPHPMPGLDASWSTTNRASEVCLRALPNTTGGYAPNVAEPAGPCFVTSERRDIVVVLGGVRLAMTATQVAASYDQANLRGIIVGFVTQTSALQALLPSYLPLVGNTPITNYLHDSDRDRASSPNGEDGFWFYVNFVAEPT